jgi:glutaminase
MVNTGAMTIAALLMGDEPISNRFEHVMQKFRSYTGGEYVGFNNST